MRNIIKGSLVFGMVFILTFTTLVIIVPENAEAEISPYDPGLELYYSFEYENWFGPPWTYTVKDDSGNGWHGETSGDQQFIDNSKFAGAMEFKGETGYIKQPQSMLLDESFSVEMWIWPDGTGEDTFFTLIDVQELGVHWRILINNDKTLGTSNRGKLLAQFNGNFYSTKTIVWNSWNHIAYTYDQDINIERFYINGHFAGEQTGHTFNCNLINQFYIGRHWNYNMYNYQGIIDEIKIYNEAILPSDGFGATVLHLGFEDHDGTESKTYDYSGFSNTGTLHGDADIIPNNHLGGKSVSFNTNGYIKVPNSDSIDITNDFTISAWICPQVSSPDYQAIVDKYEHVASTPAKAYGFTLYLHYGRIRLSVYDGTASGDITGSTDIRNFLWHHVVGTFNSEENKIRVYVDGVEEGTADYYGEPGSTNADLGIGKRLSGHGGTMYFRGYIDGLQIYTGSQYNGENVLIYPMNFNTGQTVWDKGVTQSYHGQLGSTSGPDNQDPTWTNGKFDNGLSFNLDYVTVPHNNDLDLTNSFTIEAWIKTSATGYQTMTIVDKYHASGSSEFGYTLYIRFGLLRLTIYAGTGNTIDNCDFVGTSELRDGHWHHVAGVFDDVNNKASLFVDGKIENTVTYTKNAAANNVDLGIGARLETSSIHFIGKMDNVIISNFAKTFREDTDADGMSDIMEIDSGFNSIDAADSQNDDDNDNIKNYQESIFGSNPLVESYLVEFNYFEGNQPFQELLEEIRNTWESYGYEFKWFDGLEVTNNWGDVLSIMDDNNQWTGCEGQLATQAYFDYRFNDNGQSYTHHFILFCNELYEEFDNQWLYGVAITGILGLNSLSSSMFIAVDEIDRATSSGWTDFEKQFSVTMHEIGHSVDYNLGNIDGGTHDSSPRGNSVMFKGFPSNNGDDHDWYDPNFPTQAFVPDFISQLRH